MAFKPIKTYVIPLTTTPSTAIELSEVDTLRDTAPRVVPQLMISTVGCNALASLGGSGVEADDTVTGDTFSGNNSPYLQNSIMIIGVRPNTDNHISAVALAGTGTMYVTVGYGEDV